MKRNNITYDSTIFLNGDMDFTKRKTTGIPVECPGLPDVKLAYHKEGESWIITEIGSGCMWGSARVRKDIPDAISRPLNIFGVDRVKKLVSDNTGMYTASSDKYIAPEDIEDSLRERLGI